MGFGVAQRRADLIHLHFNHGALFTFTGGVGALYETALRDYAHSLGEGFGYVLGGVTPQRAAHEQGVPVLPLARLAVVGTRG